MEQTKTMIAGAPVRTASASGDGQARGTIARLLPAIAWSTDVVAVVALAALTAILVGTRGLPNLHLNWAMGDFMIFYQAARDVAHGISPYHSPYFVSMPAFAYALTPLTQLPSRVAYAVWLVMLAVIQASALILAAPSSPRRVIHALLACSPAFLLCLLVGQPIPLLTLALSAALILERRGHPLSAGLVLSLVALKPQIALPAALCLVALRPRLIPGFAAGLVALLLAPFSRHWLASMMGFQAERQIAQESIAGVWSAVGIHTAGYLLLLGCAAVISAVIIRRRPRPEHALPILALVWFVAAPYCRPYDLTLLMLPAVLLPRLRPLTVVACILATGLSLYALPTAVLVAPLLLMHAMATSAHGATAVGTTSPSLAHSSQELVRG